MKCSTADSKSRVSVQGMIKPFCIATKALAVRCDIQRRIYDIQQMSKDAPTQACKQSYLAQAFLHTHCPVVIVVPRRQKSSSRNTS